MKQVIFTKSLTISIAPDQHAQIKKITDQRLISMGEWVRNAMAVALNNIKRKEDNM
jgi:hypothetical protein